jgi:hypothetical protein
MYAEFMTLRMHVPHLIPDMLTKWHIQLLHILEVIPFLRHAIFEFYKFIPVFAGAEYWTCFSS